MASQMQQAVKAFQQKVTELELNTARTIGGAVEAVHRVQAIRAERVEQALDKIARGQNMVVEGYNDILALEAEAEKGLVEVASELTVIRKLREPQKPALTVVDDDAKV
jgi:hypothetical protein